MSMLSRDTLNIIITIILMINIKRHPEFISESMLIKREMLKQVQHDTHWSP